MRILFTFALILLIQTSLVAQESDSLLTQPLTCSSVEVLAKAKKRDKKTLAIAIQSAKDSAHCVAPLQKILGEKSKDWKLLRKDLGAIQPQAMYTLYGIKGLSSPEQKQVFFTHKNLESSVCLALWDSVGTKLFEKDWSAKSSPFDSTDAPCKQALQDSLVVLLEKTLQDEPLRARLLQWFPDIWYSRYGESITDAEKAKYITNASLKSAEHCNLADWTTPDQLAAAGIHNNACTPYLAERFGPALMMMNFRKSFKPSTLSLIAQRLQALNPETLEQNKPFLDSLETLLGTGESWEALDSIEALILSMISKNPQALKAMKDPTAPMLMAAFNSQMSLLCDYSVPDRLITKLLMDRYQNELPLPSPEDLIKLQECLKPELWNAITRILQQLGENP